MTGRPLLSPQSGYRAAELVGAKVRQGAINAKSCNFRSPTSSGSFRKYNRMGTSAERKACQTSTSEFVDSNGNYVYVVVFPVLH